jgi:hypothetical protein
LRGRQGPASFGRCGCKRGKGIPERASACRTAARWAHQLARACRSDRRAELSQMIRKPALDTLPSTRDNALRVSRRNQGLPGGVAKQRLRPANPIDRHADRGGSRDGPIRFSPGDCLSRGVRSMELLLRAKSEEPNPPRRLRQEIPRDRETLCLNCLNKAPARRYASAAALAGDLDCCLQGERVAVRPPGLWRRLVRFLSFRKSATDPHGGQAPET